VIDVSWSKSLPALLSALSQVPGERSSSLAGEWLLASLRSKLEHIGDPFAVARLAMNVAQMAGLEDSVYNTFDAIDDGLSLASLGQYGTVDACRAELENALASYRAMPPRET
jgi:hypothetical protein